MPPDDDTVEEQTLSFRQPDDAQPNLTLSEPVHLLLLLDDNAPPKRIPLHALPAVLGRARPATVILEGPTVSRRHCRLETEDGQLRLTDLGSTNGTFINATRVTGPTPLNDGDTINVGAWRLRYHRRARDESADADAIEEELREAGKYVASILPKPILQGSVRANWFYQPSTRIGGDAFGYQMLDRGHFSLFLLDVSGHGTAAAMHAMTVAQVLRERVLPEVDFHDPAAVISGLNTRFPMVRNNELYFTIWYGVYDIAARTMIFSAAGHHPAWLLAPDNAAWPPLPLVTQNPVVGMLPDPQIVSADVGVPAGSSLHLFSDGVFEVTDRAGRQLALDDIPPLLAEVADQGRDDPRLLYDRIRAVARPGQLEDDFSALVFRFP